MSFSAPKPASPNPLPLNSLNGSNGFKIVDSYDRWYGNPIAAADVNGDGYSDIVISTMCCYLTPVLFGHANPWPASIDLHTLTYNGTTATNLTDGVLPSARRC